MVLEIFKSNIVSHLSYILGSEDEAIVVDPERDCQVYLEFAQRKNMQIRYVLETHRNEDFIVGSRELSQLSGAEIYHGPWPKFLYGKVAEDGQEFSIGNIVVRAIYTPGHTPGCVSYAVTDLESGKETVLVFTGDTLFVNDVGRTDFGGSIQVRRWSENLYESVFGRLLPLGDHVIMYPAHGSGSVCGLNIALREVSTLGIERLMNPILQLSREEFIEYKVNEHHEYWPYFRAMEKYNVEGAPFVGTVRASHKALSLSEFREKIDEGAVVVDTRSPSAFGGAHIPSSYSVPLNLLSFVSWFISPEKMILAVVDDTRDLEAVSELTRIGYDNVLGYLAGGLSSWYSLGYSTESLKLIQAKELRSWLESGKECFLLDVRSRDEFEEGHIESAKNVYLGHLQERIDEIPHGLPIAVICGSGNRASIGASVLLRNKYHDVCNFLGGMNAWRELEYPISTDAPST